MTPDRYCPSPAWAAAALLLLAGCGEDETRTIFVRVPPFPADVVQEAGGMLGYFEAAEKRTICGECHIGQQSRWENTRHAAAWEGLQQSDNVLAVCEGCHTVNALGNTIGEDTDVGWHAVQDTRYHDVQCESCHGPGLNHVQNPGGANQPLAPMQVGTDLTVGCGECHQGFHHPFVEEWEQSPHGSVVASAAGRAECEGCHVGEGVLRQWGVTAPYLEKEALEGGAESMPIVCGVCHDPHADPWGQAQLRFPVVTANYEEHLCARCHDRRTSPDPESSHGLEPHAPESALLQGDAGWFPPGSVLDDLVLRSTHGSAANPGLCATCHVNAFEVRDDEANFVFQSTGHLFLAIPCLDAQGIPTPDRSCEVSTSARSFEGCATSGCHGTEAIARDFLLGAGGRILELAEELEGLLLLVDDNLAEPGGPIDPGVPTFTIAEGAYFNLALSRHGGAAEGAPEVLVYAASAVHNPFLMETLLRQSIQEVERAYPEVAGRVSVSLEPQLTPPR